jgi:hypothetical protein
MDGEWAFISVVVVPWTITIIRHCDFPITIILGNSEHVCEQEKTVFTYTSPHTTDKPPLRAVRSNITGRAVKWGRGTRPKVLVTAEDQKEKDDDLKFICCQGGYHVLNVCAIFLFALCFIFFIIATIGLVIPMIFALVSGTPISIHILKEC